MATGLVGLEIPRKPFYERPLEPVSRGWGPRGMYDPNYAERGLDYPLPYARWRPGDRNVDEFLELLGRGAVQVDHLISHRYPIQQALDAYDLITKGGQPFIGVMLTYDEGGQDWRGQIVRLDAARPQLGPPGPRLDTAQEASTMAWPSTARFTVRPRNAGPAANPIGPEKRLFTSSPAITATGTVPPVARTLSEAAWAAPAKTITDITIVATLPISGWATMPKERARAKLAKAKGMPARTPSRMLLGGGAGSDIRGPT